MTPFSDAAWEEVFSSPVVGCFGPLILLSSANNYNVDFLTISKEDLKKFTIPLSFDINQTAVIHGLAGWFDLHFLPPSNTGDMPTLKQGDVLSMEDIMAGSSATDLESANDLEMMANTEPIVNLGVNFTSSAEESFGIPQLDPTISESYMTTSPYATPTHWQQVRFLFQEPLAINRGQKLSGYMHCEVNEFRSVLLLTDPIALSAHVAHCLYAL